MSIKNIKALHYLYYFYIVGKWGSFSKAAEKLSVTQGAISKQINTLEEMIDVKLFIRESRGVKLTQKGEILYESIVPYIDVTLAVLKKIQDVPEDKVIKIVCTEAIAHYWLAPVIYQFSEEYPDIEVHVTSTNMISPDLISSYDLGILYGAGDWDYLDTHFLFSEKITPICHNDYPIDDIQTVEDLMKNKIIQLEWPWISWKEWMALNGSEYSPQKGVLLYNQITLTLAACANKQGIALGWDFMIKDLIKNDILKKIDKFEVLTGINDYLVSDNSRELKPQAKIFKDWLLAGIENGLWKNS
jgi:LysR family transcriptional regulator, glycine cleavage system transcriptional activator